MIPTVESSVLTNIDLSVMSSFLDQKVHHGIIDHGGPLRSSDPKYMGSSYNLLVHWEDGSKTGEPLNLIVKDDGPTVAKYAVDNNMMDTPGWKFLHHFICNTHLVCCMLV